MTVTTFSFTTGATVSSWTVPNHTGTLTIEARGGDGGRVPGAVGGACAGGGGNIRATGTIPAGTVLTIAAGSGGGPSMAGSPSLGGTGGQNPGPGFDGGNGGYGGNTGYTPRGAGGGGAASTVHIGSALLIVAGGGGEAPDSFGTQLAKSVGEANGHGTVQEATGQLLDQVVAVRADLRSMHTTVESLVTSAAMISDRLKAHDREHADHHRRLDNIEKDRT